MIAGWTGSGSCGCCPWSFWPSCDIWWCRCPGGIQVIHFDWIWLLFQVFIAQSRSSGRHRDVEDEELTRIFIKIPKTFTEEDLKDTFKVRGPLHCILSLGEIVLTVHLSNLADACSRAHRHTLSARGFEPANFTLLAQCSKHLRPLR